jgi:hypothetical protein
MNLLVNVVLFVVVLLFYLNLMQEYKIGQDLDVYELDYQNAEQLNKTCQNKQPVVFRMDQGEVIADSHFINTIHPALLAEKYGKEDVLWSSSHQAGENVPIPLEKAIMVRHDEMFENNHDFIMDLPIHHYFQSIDPFLRPFGAIQTEYDFAFGNYTRLRHHQHHSYFVYAVGEDLDIKITPYKNIVAKQGLASDGYIYPDPDKNQETLLNCWGATSDEEEPDITFLNVSVPAGYCLFLPPYWWFSIRQNKSDAGQGWMAVFKYDTVMGKVVHSFDHVRNWFFRQRQPRPDDSAIAEEAMSEAEEAEEKNLLE